jgi:V/A-type H+-transporting ATPase subunit E
MADKVSSKILADAEKQVEELAAEFDEVKLKFEAELDAKKKEYGEETERLVAAEKERIRREILSEARLQARRVILEAKHETIRASFKESQETFTKSERYKDLLARIVNESGEESSILLSSKDRENLPFPWAKKAEEANISGGVILRKGSKDSNFSIDAAIESLGEVLTLELSKIMFEELPTSQKERSKD